MIESNYDYLKQQNIEQREMLDEKDETIKLQERELYEVKESILKELIKVKDIGHSDDVNKNIKILDIVEKLIDELYEDIQDELEQDLEIEYKKELSIDGKSNR